MATAAKTFDYQVRDASGKMITGQLDADSAAAVATKLRGLGYAPISIDEHKTDVMSRDLKIPGFGGKVKLKDLAIFSRQFATMINSGLSLLRALHILGEQTENPKLAETIAEIATKVEAGASLSSAVAEHDKVFPKLYVAMIRAGETAGMLDQVLMRVAATLEADVKLRSKIKSAMTYPVIVLVMAMGLTAAMLIFIVPTFAALFDTLGGELPLPTKILQKTSEFITSPIGLMTYFVAPFAIWQAFKAYRRTPGGRFQLDVIKLKLPVFGVLFHKIAITRFSRNLSTLMRAGVPILQALEITAETVDNGVIGAATKDVQDSVREGNSLNGPLKEHEVFPPMVVQMIAVGEETGAIDTMLEKIADFYDTEVETMTEQLTALMEPVMIAILGTVVGSMVIALYMPIFKIIDAVGNA